MSFVLEWLEQCHYQAFAVLSQSNKVSIMPMSLAYLNQVYEELKDYTDSTFVDLLYVLDYIHMVDSQLW